MARARIAVIGAGLLGLTAALLLAEEGCDTVVYERAPTAHAGASDLNEGKVHLGLVYGLADRSTHELMLRGALAFAPILDRAAGTPLPWDDLVSDPFEYLVMPDSLLDADGFARHVTLLNGMLDALAAEGVTHAYPGGPITRAGDPVPRRDPVTGFPAFRTAERAVDPTRLGALLVAAATSHPRIELRTDAQVRGVDATDGVVTVGDGPAARRDGAFAAVLNCAWDGRSRIAAAAGDPSGHLQNIRVKAVVRLRPTPAARTVTLVQGPYGDVVGHRDYTYVSWYPIGRLHHEVGFHPSAAVDAAVRRAGESPAIAVGQVRALARLGLVDEAASIIHTGAGVILAEGTRDIDDRGSLLHHRGRHGVRRHGRLLTPLSLKLTTAPLAARDAVASALELAGHAAR